MLAFILNDTQMFSILVNRKKAMSVYCIFCTIIALVSSAGLYEDFTWTRLNYVWPNKQLHKRHVHTGSRYGVWNEGSYFNTRRFNTSINKDHVQDSLYFEFIDYQYENNIPMGANVWKNKLFITVPRRRLGVPSTLNYVYMDQSQRHNVPLIPYPNWDINLYPSFNTRSVENFVSVYRVTVDTCDRLWFIDTGILELPGNRTQVKPMSLIIIDLQTDTIIRRYSIPRDQLKEASLIVTVTVDVNKQRCDNAFAYLPDFVGYGLIVYSLRQDRSWRISHNYFFVEPLAGDLRIGGYRFQWNDGIFSVELSKIKSDSFRDAYFHPMAGTHMYRVSTRILQNETLATRSYHKDDFQPLGDRGPKSQTSLADIDKYTDIMFLGLISINGLGCWNINHKFSEISIIHKDNRKMIYPSDVKVYNNRVYVLTNSMPQFAYGRLNYDQVNFRVWSNSITDSIKGTNCEKTGWIF